MLYNLVQFLMFDSTLADFMKFFFQLNIFMLITMYQFMNEYIWCFHIAWAFQKFICILYFLLISYMYSW